MNLTPEIRRFVSDEVRRQLELVLTGQVATGIGADVQNELIANLYPGSPTTTARPVVHPYGYASRAPVGVLNVSVRQGADPGSRLIIGHRDSARPALQLGETVVYNFAGYQIKLGLTECTISNGSATETLVLGNVLLEFLNALMDLIANHTHPSEGAPPTEQAQFQQLIAQYLDPVPAILASKQGGF